MSFFRWFFVVTFAAGLCAGCAHHRPRHAVAQRPPAEKPWIGTRSLCVFPMVKAPPRPEPDALAAAMTAGWKSRLVVPDGAELVRIEPGNRPAKFDTIAIDLSDVRVNPGDSKNRLKPLQASQGIVTADHFELVARPLLLEKARLLIGLNATDARLDVRRDRAGRSMLTFTDARDATLTMQINRGDIDWLLLRAARVGAAAVGVSVDRTRLKLDITDSRVIKVDLKVDTRVGFLPAGLRFKARVDIDENLNGRMTRLSCDGDQLLGPIISSFIDPALRKYEGLTRPLVGFEWGEMKLRTVTMDSDDGFRLAANFGREPGAKKPPPAPQRPPRRSKRHA
jgi:hypothetical protein